MKEVWKDIPDYEGLYQVSNLGRVRSLDRIVECSNGQKKHRKERILKPRPAHNGYLVVTLCRNNKPKTKKVHRLVAKAFVPNPSNYPQVNHINENRTDDVASNLEWCDCKYNNNYGCHNEHVAKAQSKQVLQFTLDGHFIKRWPSLMEVQRQLGFSCGNISSCCNSKRKIANGYVWRYSNAKN